MSAEARAAPAEAALGKATSVRPLREERQALAQGSQLPEERILDAMQDFFQVLRPGLQLLRPPKKDELGSAGIVAGFVGYSYDAFKQEFGIEPDQVWHPDQNDFSGLI